MDEDALIARVEAYFRAVDGGDIDRVLDLLAPDCVFTVETHGIEVRGHREIAAMLGRLHDRYARVWHGDFTHVPAPARGLVASRFTVRNWGHDGTVHEKSNCNFFTSAGGRFSRIAVYMAGDNTLTAA